MKPKKLSIYRREHAETPWVIADEDGPIYYRRNVHEAMQELEKRQHGRQLKRLLVEFDD